MDKLAQAVLLQKSVFLHRWFKAALLAEIRPGSIPFEEWQTEQETKATEKAQAIHAFLVDEKNKSLRLLAGVPLLLQIMAMIKMKIILQYEAERIIVIKLMLCAAPPGTATIRGAGAATMWVFE